VLTKSNAKLTAEIVC